MKELGVDSSRTIKSVALLTGHTFIVGIRFTDKYDRIFFEYKTVKENNYFKWQEQVIPAGKEIIGVHGNNKAH